MAAPGTDSIHIRVTFQFNFNFGTNQVVDIDRIVHQFGIGGVHEVNVAILGIVRDLATELVVCSS